MSALLYQNIYIAVFVESQQKKAEKSKAAQISIVANEVAKLTGVSVEQMQMRTRKYEIKLARHLCYCFAKKYVRQASCADIGNFFGGYDHTSILHGIASVKDLRDTDDEIRSMYNHLDNIFNR